MKRLVVKLLIFSLYFLPFAIALDFVASGAARLSGRNYIVRINDVMQGGIDADILIMGNSRAGTHVSPSVMDSLLHVPAWNLGVDGANFRQQYARYKLYRQFNHIPRLILLNVDQSTFAPPNTYEREKYFPFFWNSSFRHSVFPIETFSKAERFIPLYRYLRVSYRVLFQATNKRARQGFASVDLEWDDKNRERYKGTAFIPDSSTVKLLDGFLEEAFSEGIRVALFFSPICPDYLRDILHYDQMIPFYEDFAQNHGVPFLDFSSMFEGDKEWFFDGLHLNDKGSRAFTDSLSTAVMQSGLLGDNDKNGLK